MSPTDTKKLSWLLKLPQALEKRFYQDGSVQRTFTMFDLLAITQAFLVNVRLLQSFGRPSDPGQEVMLLRERVMSVIYITLALFQIAFMRLRPQQYKAHRHWIALCNRLLRLLAVGLGALSLTPEEAKRQVNAWLSTGFPSSCADHAHQQASDADLIASALGHVHPSTDGVDGCPSGVSMHGNSIQGLLQALLVTPAVYLLHANFVVSFKFALLMQLGTFAALIWMLARRACVFTINQPVAAALAVPACEALSWLAHAGSRLLDLPLLAGDADSSTGGLPLWREPLQAVLLMKLWINVVVVVLLPCAVIYSLERSLKVRFLSTLGSSASALVVGEGMQAGQETPAAASAGGQLRGVGDCNQREPLQQQQQPLGPRQVQQQLQQPQQLQQEQSSTQGLSQGARANPAPQLQTVLDSIPPLSVCEMPPMMLCVLQMAAAMLALVGCWYACEALLSLVLRGGHFVCDADGWLSLAAN